MTLAVEFRGLNKSFRGVSANRDICLKIKKGSIHAIIGENGAGKSTAMKILYGTYQPDSGDILIDEKVWGGRGKPWASPSDAIHCGIGMVHQHFMLAAPHTVLDNILLGVETSSAVWKWLLPGFRPLDRKSARKKLNQLSAQYGLHVDLDAKVESLSVGVQQRIEILKLLYRDAKILILDEPTAVLTPKETLELFENLKKLCHQGKTVIIITHKLKEVMNLANRVTVFRAGLVVGEREIHETNIEDLACLMVGRKVNIVQEAPPLPVLKGPVLEMKGVSTISHFSGNPSGKAIAKASGGTSSRKLQNIDLSVHGGEIVGISGVEGNGQAELIQAILHPRDHSASGTIRLFGQNIAEMSTEQIKAMGMGVIPDDRLRDGLLLNRPVRENFLLGLQRKVPFNRYGMIAFNQLEEATSLAIKEYDVRPKMTGIRAGALSGGNQQKLVIAREFKYSPKFVIAAQPTRGVDVGAVEFIHKRILKARSEGSGVLLISSELDEILALADRILVMYEGRIIAEFPRGAVTEKELGMKMGGAAQ